MALNKRERNRRAFAAMLKERGLNQSQVATLLHCSQDAIKAWLKPETSSSSNPVPLWAMELLAFKMPVNSTLERGQAFSVKKRAAR